MKVHLERTHGLAPFLPDQSKEDWVYAQLYTLAEEYAKAEMAGDKEKTHRVWNSLISLFTYHRGLFPIERIPEIIGKERRRLSKRIGRSA